MPGIDGARLTAALKDRYAKIDVVERTGSTNADLRKAVEEGAADRTVLLAEEQTAGVGRRARPWSLPKSAGLYLSVALRPSGVSFCPLASLTGVAGLAVRAAAAG